MPHNSLTKWRFNPPKRITIISARHEKELVIVVTWKKEKEVHWFDTISKGIGFNAN